jgi:hypothetical protein
MMETARTSETLVNFYQTTWRYNPEDSHLGLFYSAYVSAQIFSSTVIPRFLPLASFTPYSSHKLHVTRGLSLAYAVTVVTCVVLFSRILLLMILPLDSIVESKRKYKSDNEAKKSCKL